MANRNSIPPSEKNGPGAAMGNWKMVDRIYFPGDYEFIGDVPWSDHRGVHPFYSPGLSCDVAIHSRTDPIVG